MGSSISMMDWGNHVEIWYGMVQFGDCKKEKGMFFLQCYNSGCVYKQFMEQIQTQS